MTIDATDAQAIVSTINQAIEQAMPKIREMVDARINEALLTVIYPEIESQREGFAASLTQVGENQQVIWGVANALAPLLAHAALAAPGEDGGISGGVYPSEGTTERPSPAQAEVPGGGPGDLGEQLAELMSTPLLRKKGE